MVTFMDKSEIAKLAPSVFASKPCDRMSDRYSFVPSASIVEQFDALGWGVTRRSSADIFREILVTNSSDGSSSLKLAAGLFALVCSNGLVIQSLDLGSFTQRHMNLSMDSVSEAIQSMSNLVPNIADNIDSMANLPLDAEEQFQMAQAGKVARWGAASEIDSRELLNPRRQEDIGSDLWTVFNRVQENTIRGGFKGEGQKRLARELTNIDALSRVNLNLWNAAEEILAAA